MAKKKNDNATGAGLYIGCLLMMTIGIVFITLFSIAIQLIRSTYYYLFNFCRCFVLIRGRRWSKCKEEI